MRKNVIKKAVISFIMALSFLLNGIFAAGADTLRGMDYIAKRLTVFNHEDRTNIETIFIPMLITDTGLDALIDVVSDYTPESEAFMHVMLTKFLVRVEKQEVIDTLSYLYMIDEKVREDYIGGYYQRKELALSAEGEKSLNALMDVFFSKYPDLRAVFEEDKVTAAVVARVIKMFYAVNANTPLFKANSAELLELNYIAPDLKNKINQALEKNNHGFQSADDFFEKIIADLNANYAGVHMRDFIKFGTEAGIVLKTGFADAGGNSSAGGEGLSSVELAFDKNTLKLKITGKGSDGRVVEDGEYKTFAVSFDCDVKGYLADPDGNPVRLCICENGVWYAYLTKLGEYTVIPSAENYFEDTNGWGKDYINALFERKIINGRSESSFCPDDNITREEFVKLIVELFDLKGDFGAYFTDVLPESWYYPYVSASKYYGIVDGYPDGTFGVGKNITRQDMCKVLYSVIEKMGVNIDSGGIALEFADKELIATYAYPSVMALKKARIVSGDDRGRFNPTYFATRQEAAKLIYNILLNYVKD